MAAHRAISTPVHTQTVRKYLVRIHLEPRKCIDAAIGQPAAESVRVCRKGATLWGWFAGGTELSGECS